MSFENRLDKIINKFNELNDKLMNSIAFTPMELAKLSKEMFDLRSVAELSIKYKALIAEINSLENAVIDPTIDSNFKALVEEEIHDLKHKILNIHKELQVLLIPKDKDDEKNAILEIRAGTGGQEAALFAAVLFKMYMRYSERQGWKFEILSISDTGLDGYKEASASIGGKGVFAKLKFESGVHRVQRIPETESNGRIHTSAATVAVLPEAEEVDVALDDKDLRIDVFRAGGSGGQHVNTTDSAVRITHIPTGLVVNQQDEKSQHKNKAKALKILRSRIYDMQKSQKDAQMSSLRKEQIGSGDRSERIRTYNYPQNRVTDHRINLTLHALEKIVDEGEIDDVINALRADDQARKLSSSSDDEDM